MNKLPSLIVVMSLMATPVISQTTVINRDTLIEKMVREVSSARIEQNVRKLVSFYTRHDLSEQMNPGRGIGAAWAWIKSEMEKSVPQSNGRIRSPSGGRGLSPGRQGRWLPRLHWPEAAAH